MRGIWQNERIGDPVFDGFTLGGLFTGTTLVKEEYPGLRAIRVAGVMTLATDLPASYPVPSVDPSGIYVGMLMPYAGATPPTGWLVCNGQAISRTTYAALFAAIGTVHGAGDGSTTFNVPDARDRTMIGVGTNVALGAKAGSFNHAHSIATHDHSIDPPSTASSSDSHSHTVDPAAANTGATATTAIGKEGTGASFEYVIKTHVHSANTPSTTSSSDAHSHTTNIAAFDSGGSGTLTTDTDNQAYIGMNLLIKALAMGGGGSQVELWY